MMWDFSIGRTLWIVVRTWPFVLFRILVYTAITAGYVLATGTGAGVGYGVGHVFADPAGPLGFAFWGGIIGFTLTSVVIYWIREYILYILKAGHIAVMVHLIDGRPIPGGTGQIAYARRVVAARFGEANLLFLIDQLVKGVLRVIAGMLGGIAGLLPIPGLSTLIGFVNAVIRMSVTHVDEIILGYNIRRDSNAPFETACQGVVLYAQNGRGMLKNALWLTIFTWAIGVVVFLASLAPAAAVLYYMPGQIAGWAFVLAIVCSWAFIASFVEPFCIAALMQVYFERIEGQVPNAEWERRLEEASASFRDLKQRAMRQISDPAAWGRAAGL